MAAHHIPRPAPAGLFFCSKDPGAAVKPGAFW